MLSLLCDIVDATAGSRRAVLLLTANQHSPELPDILKQFTKAAIRTQPKDVLAWSAA